MFACASDLGSEVFLLCVPGGVLVTCVTVTGDELVLAAFDDACGVAIASVCPNVYRV